MFHAYIGSTLQPHCLHLRCVALRHLLKHLCVICNDFFVMVHHIKGINLLHPHDTTQLLGQSSGSPEQPTTPNHHHYHQQHHHHPYQPSHLDASARSNDFDVSGTASTADNSLLDASTASCTATAAPSKVPAAVAARRQLHDATGARSQLNSVSDFESIVGAFCVAYSSSACLMCLVRSSSDNRPVAPVASVAAERCTTAMRTTTTSWSSRRARCWWC